jgi:hypothetical protein
MSSPIAFAPSATGPATRAASPAPQPAAKRKPAPAVTPSVIRAVKPASADARHLPILPSASSPLALPPRLATFAQGTDSAAALSLSPSLAAIVRNAVDEDLPPNDGTLRPPKMSAAAAGSEAGMTPTAQKRYDGAMQEVRHGRLAVKAGLSTRRTDRRRPEAGRS